MGMNKDNLEGELGNMGSICIGLADPTDQSSQQLLMVMKSLSFTLESGTEKGYSLVSHSCHVNKP